MNRRKWIIFVKVILITLLVSGCGNTAGNITNNTTNNTTNNGTESSVLNGTSGSVESSDTRGASDSDEGNVTNGAAGGAESSGTNGDAGVTESIGTNGDAVVTESIGIIFTGEPYCIVNNNVRFFTSGEITTDEYENYSPLDFLGRCGVASANISPATLPTEERGAIGQVKPSGWHTVKYNDIIEGNYLYNRCHLIAYELAGENANELNLITGTRYMNVQGMLPFENKVADYVKETGNHVLYRVTPVFKDNELVARGVIMEAFSVEDNGSGICFCIYVFNVQPGIEIDYSDGNSWVASGNISENIENTSDVESSKSEADLSQGITYVLNRNTKKFHYESCSSVQDMKEQNKEIVTGNRDDIINRGYEPCKRCNP